MIMDSKLATRTRIHGEALDFRFLRRNYIYANSHTQRFSFSFTQPLISFEKQQQQKGKGWCRRKITLIRGIPGPGLSLLTKRYV